MLLRSLVLMSALGILENGKSDEQVCSLRLLHATDTCAFSPMWDFSLADDNPCDWQPCIDMYQKVIVLGDLHGDYKHTILLLKGANVLGTGNHWIGGSRTLLVQMGDIADRGPNAPKLFALFRQLRSEAARFGSRVIQLFGNHECLNLCGRFHYVHPDEVHYFGNREKMEAAWKADGEIGRDVRENFEVAAQIDNVVFVHAGIVPKFAVHSFAKLKSRLLQQIDEENCPWPSGPVLSSVKKREAAWNLDEKTSLDVLGDLGPTWTRLLVMDNEATACPMLQRSLELLGARIMVVGHTLTESGDIHTRCNGSLIMVDTGISSFVRNNPKALIFENGLWKELSSIQNERAAAICSRRNGSAAPYDLSVFDKCDLIPTVRRVVLDDRNWFLGRFGTRGQSQQIKT